MACKSAIVIVTIKAGTELGLTATPSSRLVLSLPRKVLFLALDRVADPGKSKAVGGFWCQQILILFSMMRNKLRSVSANTDKSVSGSNI